MTGQPCTLPAEDLIAYTDGYLTGGRRELVEAHLKACLHCRERVAAFHEVDRLLQESTPLTDDPNGRAMIRTRLEREAGRSTSSLRARFAPLLLLLLLLGLVLIAGPIPAIEAGFPLSRFVSFGEIEPSTSREESTLVEHVAPSDPSVSALPFRTVEPAKLPLGLVRIERSVPGPERLQLLYRDGDDLAILILQAPARPGMVTIDDASRMETTLVGDTPVLIGRGTRPDSVADLHWEHEGVFFTMLVIESPTGAYGGLKTADALEIVEAVIAAQDSGQ